MTDMKRQEKNEFKKCFYYRDQSIGVLRCSVTVGEVNRLTETERP